MGDFSPIPLVKFLAPVILKPPSTVFRDTPSPKYTT